MRITPVVPVYPYPDTKSSTKDKQNKKGENKR
jgi:hypothetical protein